MGLGKWNGKRHLPITPIPDRLKEQGPVCIVDAKGVYPNALDRAVEEQAAYYRRSK